MNKTYDLIPENPADLLFNCKFDSPKKYSYGKSKENIKRQSDDALGGTFHRQCRNVHELLFL